MQKKVEYSARALRNLESIKAYISPENPAAAIRVVSTLTKIADGLSEQPVLGKPWKREGTRKLVAAKYPYLIIYRVTAKAIIILAVAHQSRKNT